MTRDVIGVGLVGKVILTVLILLLALIASGFVSLGFSDNPDWIISLLGISSAASPKYEALKFLGISMGGLLIAIQAAIANKRAKAMEDTANAQAKATEEQAKTNRLTEQGQRQERLKNAIEHLGHHKDSVRLGGAYELFHLARDTPDKGLRQTVLDILCAHIRHTTWESEYREKHKSKPSEEVQSLLSLLFVQDHDVFGSLRINLRECWLVGADLGRGRLQNAILIQALMQAAKLAGANLEEANLTEVHMQGADLTGARLQKACLRGAWMHGACLDGSWFTQAELYGVKMQGAALRGAKMQGAFILHAEMQAADLYDARFQSANLAGVGLQGARLSRGQFQAATFDGVYLGGVDSDMSSRIEERIRNRVGMRASLAGTIFQGGLTEQDVSSILEAVRDQDPRVLRASLEPHISAPTSHQLPQGQGINTDPYTEVEAEQWIAEYEEAMSELSE